MPIVFVHGVATRADNFAESWADIERYLRRYAAPSVSDEPDRVAILPAFWGDLASRFRFGGISKPRSALLGMGADENAVDPLAAMEFAALLPPPQPGPAAAGALVPAGPGDAADGEPVAVRRLSADELSDFAVACAHAGDGRSPAIAWLVAADEAAHDPAVLESVRTAPDDREALRRYTDAVERWIVAADDHPGLARMGAGSGWPEWLRRMTEAADRIRRTPGFVASRVLSEARKPINDNVVRFLGDVFVYLSHRRAGDGGPGPIPAAVLATLRDADRQRLGPDEPMVVVTHSMGGQIVYDLVTHFLPHAENTPRIDFWCATASQVGLFLELDLFAAADAGVPPLPRPPARWLGAWWNVWDHNDFLSFTVRDIVADVDDEPYSSGLSVAGAHSGYLRRPSFYRHLQAKLDQAGDRNWDRSAEAAEA